MVASWYFCTLSSLPAAVRTLDAHFCLVALGDLLAIRVRRDAMAGFSELGPKLSRIDADTLEATLPARTRMQLLSWPANAVDSPAG